MTTKTLFGLLDGGFGRSRYWYVLVAAFLLIAASFVLIRERQVGVVVKRFARRSLVPGRLIALAG